MAEVCGWVCSVDFVKEHDAGVAGLPRVECDVVEDVFCFDVRDGLFGVRVDEGVVEVFVECFHEGVRDGDAEVEVGEVAFFGFCADEFEDVGVVDAEDAHVGASALAALFDDVGGDVEHAHEADGS